MRGFSVEQTPAELARRRAFPDAVPVKTRVYVTWIPGAPSAAGWSMEVYGSIAETVRAFRAGRITSWADVLSLSRQ